MEKYIFTRGEGQLIAAQLCSDNDCSSNHSTALSLNQSAAIPVLTTHPISHVASHLTPANIKTPHFFAWSPSVQRICGLSVVGAGFIFTVSGDAAL